MLWCSKDNNFQSSSLVPRRQNWHFMHLKASLTALFASGSSLKLYSLFFKPHPHSLDFFPACLLEMVEPSPFLQSVSFFPTGSSRLSQEFLSSSPIQNCLLVHDPQSFSILVQNSIQIMFFPLEFNTPFPICSSYC